MIRTELGRVAPALRELSWPISGASRWSHLPESGQLLAEPPASSEDLEEPEPSDTRPSETASPSEPRVSDLRELRDTFDADDMPWSDCRASRSA